MIKILSVKQVITIGFFTPLLLCVLIAYLVFGNPYMALIKMFELRGNPNKTADAVASLSYIWTFLITIYGIGITALFSFLVWKVSERSLQVSKDIKQLEESRDSELIREQALIVYYDIQRGITYLRDLYISTVINKEKPNPKRLYFSNDWIKNVATLRNELSSEKLAKVYEIYNDFFTIQSLLDSQTDEKTSQQEISNLVEIVAEKMFADFVPLPLLKTFNEATPDDLLEIDLYIILQQIYLLTFPANQITKEEINPNSYTLKVKGINYYTVLNKDKFDGEGILYTLFGYEKAKGQFAFGQFTTGEVYGYLNSNRKLYNVAYSTTSKKRKLLSGNISDPNSKNEDELYFMDGNFSCGKIQHGITTSFTPNGIITYRGSVVDGIHDGKGSSFDSTTGEILFKGTYKEGQKYKGSLFKDGREVFNGEFRYNNPWNGNAIKYTDKQSLVLNFTGEIKKGKPFTGSGYKHKRNEHGESLEELAYREEQYFDSIEKNYDEEYIIREENNLIRQEYEYWDEYIITDWTNGYPTMRENTESNIKVIGNR